MAYEYIVIETIMFILVPWHTSKIGSADIFGRISPVILYYVACRQKCVCSPYYEFYNSRLVLWTAAPGPNDIRALIFLYTRINVYFQISIHHLGCPWLYYSFRNIFWRDVYLHRFSLKSTAHQIMSLGKIGPQTKTVGFVGHPMTQYNSYHMSMT